MNFKPDFIRSAPFVKFKRALDRPEALEYIFLLCQKCQLDRNTELSLGDDLDLEITLGLQKEVEASKVRELLVWSGFIKQIDDSDIYSIELFTEMNRGLLANWNNGNMGGRPRRKAQDSPPEEKIQFPTSSYSKTEVPF